MLSTGQIQAYYLTYPLKLPGHWTQGRRHLRVVLKDGRFVKLNHFQNRLSEKDLKYYCWSARAFRHKHKVDNHWYVCPHYLEIARAEKLAKFYIFS
jgi:hypothetical protein